MRCRLTRHHSTKRNMSCCLWCSRLKRTASRERYGSSWNISGSREKPNVDSDVPELDLQIEHLADDVASAAPAPVIASLISNSASERVCSTRISRLPSRTLTTERCDQFL